MQAQSLSNRAASHPQLPPSFPVGVTAGKQGSIADGFGLAHDAGNLLAALRLYTDLLAAPGVLRPQHAHYAREISLLTDRTSAWIGRLLKAGDGMEMALDPPFTLADGAAALRALEPLLQRLAQPWAHVTVRVSTGLPPLPFPAESLERIALNLVRNAAEALASSPSRDEPGEILVALEAVTGGLTLTVKDNGPGLPRAAAARLVLGSAKRRTRHGRGLGHAIVHELAEASGGTVDVRVALGCGTAITLSWRMDQPTAARRVQGAFTAC